ncbi:MAG: DUF2802 domain-containing protein [Burkholderiaceae bacterium]|nr:DUF2802 domain-containing protein [Sulfuritalea sp.]MCF8176826.1 DUF2802 domain-containing protein [Burkholderiaceae bacterium]
MIDLSTLDLRDYVYLFAALVLVYAILLLLRLWRINRNQVKANSQSLVAVAPPWVSGHAVESKPHHSAAPGDYEANSPGGAGQDMAEAGEADPEPVFADELARSKQENEVQRLRREVEHLRAETAHLAEEIRYLKTARNVSPLYSEAMTLAQQDIPAAGIADRCGISIGEAELVAALARGESGFEIHKKEEDRDDRDIDSTH